MSNPDKHALVSIRYDTILYVTQKKSEKLTIKLLMSVRQPPSANMQVLLNDSTDRYIIYFISLPVQ